MDRQLHNVFVWVGNFKRKTKTSSAPADDVFFNSLN